MHSGVNSLLKLNVNEHVEKKNGLSYLSWAWAWDQALRADPSAKFNVESWTDDSGKTRCWMDVNGTALVWVSVTMLGQTRTCMLPVMDHRNKSITNPDAFQINTAIMRCMTKCLALFGLGLYIYAGEDLPLDEGETQEVVKAEPKKVEPKAVEVANTDSLKLFSETMLHYLDLAKTEKALRSYWKSNQTTLDQLKGALPDVYADIVEKFKARKDSLTKEEA